MDSRSKILSSREASAVAAATICRGYFDPLLAAHARALAACPRPLAVQVLDPERPLLPLEARQLLVAALAVVDFVLPPDAPVQPTLDWCSQHAQIREEFIRHVHDKSSQTA